LPGREAVYCCQSSGTKRKPHDNRIQIAAQTLILGQQPISAEEPESATPESHLLEPIEAETNREVVS